MKSIFAYFWRSILMQIKEYDFHNYRTISENENVFENIFKAKFSKEKIWNNIFKYLVNDLKDIIRKSSNTYKKCKSHCLMFCDKYF